MWASEHQSDTPELSQLWPALRNQADHLLKLMFAFSQEMVTSISRGIDVPIKAYSKKYSWGSKHRIQLFCLGWEWFKTLTTAIVSWTRFAGEGDHCELSWLRIWPTVLNYALYSSAVKKKLISMALLSYWYYSRNEHGIQDQNICVLKPGMWDEKTSKIAGLF